MPHRVTLIPGDGIGPELSDATRRVLEATGVTFDWDVREAGADVMAKHGGNPLPESVIDSIARTGVAIKGPITTPVGTGFRSVNVALRKALDLFAQVRPCKSYEGVRSRYDDVDLVIVRENTEDLYAGIEFEEGTENCAVLRDTIQKLSGAQIREDAGISIKPISIEGTRRVVHVRARLRPPRGTPQGHGRPQGQHHEAHRRPLAARRARGRRGLPATSSSRIASSTTCACSSCRSPSCTT